MISPSASPPSAKSAVRSWLTRVWLDEVFAAVRYVAGMTDRFAFRTAVSRLGWPADRLPKGIVA